MILRRRVARMLLQCEICRSQMCARLCVVHALSNGAEPTLQDSWPLMHGLMNLRPVSVGEERANSCAIRSVCRT